MDKLTPEQIQRARQLAKEMESPICPFCGEPGVEATTHNDHPRRKFVGFCGHQWSDSDLLGADLAELSQPDSSHSVKRSDVLAVTLFFLGVGMTLLLGPEWGWPFLLAGIGGAGLYFIMWRSANPAWLQKGLAGVLVIFLLASLAVIAWKLRPITTLMATAKVPAVPTNVELSNEFARASLRHQSPPIASVRTAVHGEGATTVGTITVQPGGIASFGQQGGVTAGVVNITPVQPIPELTDFQKSTIRHDLKEAGPHSVAVRFSQGNERSSHVADQFKDLMTLSGWTLRRPKFLIETSLARGIFILVDESDLSSPPDTATLLQNALSDSGLPTKIIPVEGLGKGDVDLAIGIQ